MQIYAFFNRSLNYPLRPKSDNPNDPLYFDEKVVYKPITVYWVVDIWLHYIIGINFNINFIGNFVKSSILS